MLALILLLGLFPAPALRVRAEDVSGGGVSGAPGDVDVPLEGEETGPTEDSDAPLHNSTLTVTPGKITAYHGDVVILTVTLTGNNPWSSLGYLPVLDSPAFEVISGEVLPAGQSAQLRDFTAADGGVLYYSQPAATEGALFRFAVRIRDDAPAGKYSVTHVASLQGGKTAVPTDVVDAVISVSVRLPEGATERGDCGDDLVWTLYEDGRLVISGTGAMWACDDPTAAPWYRCREFVRTVVLEGNVTAIAPRAFACCTALVSFFVDAENSCYSSDDSGLLLNKDKNTLVFIPCAAVKIEIPAAVTEIADNAFYGCGRLTDVYYKGSVALWSSVRVGKNNENLYKARLHTADDQFCDHCGQIVFRNIWTGEDRPVSGHYFLTGDVAGERLSIAAGTDVVLDLMGYTCAAGMTVMGELNLTDSVGGGNITGGTASDGGNILVTDGGYFGLYGGTVSGGTAERGGNICVTKGAQAMIAGGTVVGGKGDIGGNIAVMEGASLAVIGGSVLDGAAPDGGNIYVSGDSLFGITGGIASGDVVICEGGFAYLEGQPVVAGGKGLVLHSGVQLVVGAFGAGASVGITATGVFAQPGSDVAEYLPYFYHTDPNWIIAAVGDSLTAIPKDPTNGIYIIQHPADVEIVAGFGAVFTVEATDVASYKWQYRRNENAPWVNTTLGGNKTNTLTVPAILSRNGYQYRCRITGNNGKILYTEPATLTVLDSIIITSQPTRQIVNVNDNATFTLIAEGAGLTYQWLYRKGDDDFWKQTGMEGNKTNTLTVPAILSRNGYQYMCAITDENGIKINSKVSVLSTIGFAAHPEDQCVPVNTQAVFSVTAEGQEIVYQWQYRKSEKSGWFNTSLPGATTDTLTVEALASRNGYQYRCRITDARGTIRYSEEATLTVE